MTSLAFPCGWIALALTLPLLASSAQAACDFATMNQRSPFGQSLAPHLKQLGPSGFSRLPGEEGWLLDQPEFATLKVRAPLADYIWIGTYQARVLKFNLRFPTRRLQARQRNLARELDACATRVSEKCWKDDAGIVLQLGNNSRQTYLYMMAPEYASPEDTDVLPQKCRTAGKPPAAAQEQMLPARGDVTDGKGGPP